MKLTIARSVTETIDTNAVIERNSILCANAMSPSVGAVQFCAALRESNDTIRALVSRVSELEAAAQARPLDLPDCNTFEVVGTGASGTSATAQPERLHPLIADRPVFGEDSISRDEPAPRWPTDSKGFERRPPLRDEWFWSESMKCWLDAVGGSTTEYWTLPGPGRPKPSCVPDAFAPQAAPATAGVTEIGGGWTLFSDGRGVSLRWNGDAICNTFSERYPVTGALRSLARAASIGFKAGEGGAVTTPQLEAIAYLTYINHAGVGADEEHPEHMTEAQAAKTLQPLLRLWQSRRAAGERTGG